MFEFDFVPSRTMASNGVDAPPVKKSRPDENAEDEVQRDLQDLSGFHFERVLSDAAEEKRIVVLGKFIGKGDDESMAVIVLEKIPFAGDKVKDFLNHGAKLHQQFRNGIYSLYTANISDDRANEVKVNVVWPATQQHVDKYSSNPGYMINETPALYNVSKDF